MQTMIATEQALSDTELRKGKTGSKAKMHRHAANIQWYRTMDIDYLNPIQSRFHPGLALPRRKASTVSCQTRSSTYFGPLFSTTMTCTSASWPSLLLAFTFGKFLNPHIDDYF
jgi:hypothetical protein